MSSSPRVFRSEGENFPEIWCGDFTNPSYVFLENFDMASISCLKGKSGDSSVVIKCEKIRGKWHFAFDEFTLTSMK